MDRDEVRLTSVIDSARAKPPLWEKRQAKPAAPGSRSDGSLERYYGKEEKLSALLFCKRGELELKEFAETEFGTIAILKFDRGFGFIERRTGKVFFPATGLIDGFEFDKLQPGMLVEFYTRETARGPQAFGITIRKEKTD